jgi:hypothetical protein
MACGAITTLAMTAILLGQQTLKVESHRNDDTITVCDYADASNPNAVFKLKDSAGRTLLSRQIRVAQMNFYTTPKKRGVFAAKSATFFFSYPQTDKTEQATSVELASLDGSFVKSSKLPAVKEPPTMRFK